MTQCFVLWLNINMTSWFIFSYTCEYFKINRILYKFTEFLLIGSFCWSHLFINWVDSSVRLSILWQATLTRATFCKWFTPPARWESTKIYFQLWEHKSLHCYKWDIAAFGSQEPVPKWLVKASTAGNKIYFPFSAENSYEILTLITGYWADKSP